jgi:hypothetical protein
VRACDTGMDDSRVNFGNKKKSSFFEIFSFPKFCLFLVNCLRFRLFTSAFKFSLQCFTPLFTHASSNTLAFGWFPRSCLTIHLASSIPGLCRTTALISPCLLSHSVVRNITLLPLPPLRLLLLLLLLLLLSLLLLPDSLAFSYLRHPLLDVHLHSLGSIVYCSNSCSFAATDFLLSSASAPPSPSSLYFQVIFFGLPQCLRFMLSWLMALQELRPWRGASCHEHVVIAMGLVFKLVFS